MCVICFPKALSTLSSYKVKMRICTLKLEEERGIKFRTNASYRLKKSNGLIQKTKPNSTCEVTSRAQANFCEAVAVWKAI